MPMHACSRTVRRWAWLASAAWLLAACGTPPQPAAGVVEVQLLAINDFHGHLEPPSAPLDLRGAQGEAREPVAAGGAAQLATLVNALRKEQPNTLFVSSGDLIGASPPVSALFRDEPTIEAMNLMGLDINGVGNHEFDHGTQELLRLAQGGCHPQRGCFDGRPYRGARFDILAANVLTESGATLFPATVIKTVAGVKLGFIGLTLRDTPQMVTPASIRGLKFEDEIAAIRRNAQALRAQGAQAVIVLLHQGGTQAGGINDCQDLQGPVVRIAQGVLPQVDALLSAHTHQAYVCMIDGKPVTSAGSYGRLLTQLKLKIDPARGAVVGSAAQNLVVRASLAPEPRIAALVADYQARSKPQRERVIGCLPGELSNVPGANGQSALGQWIADAQLLIARRELGAGDVAFMNPGGIRAPLKRQPDGCVQYGDAFTTQPFGNSITVLELDGAQLLAVLERQLQRARPLLLQASAGLRYEYDLRRPAGARVLPGSVTIDGRPLDAARSYRVVVNSFLASGGDGFVEFAAGRNARSGPGDVEAIEAALQAKLPLPAALDQIRRLDAAP